MQKEFALSGFGEKIAKIGSTVMDLVYPDSLYCICCGNIIDDTRSYSLCDHCIKHIRWDRTAGKVISGDGAGKIRALRVCEYGIYERTIIFSLKYNGKRYIARNIADMMYDKLKLAGLTGGPGSPAFDVIVPVPLGKKKMRERGFNQTALIGKYLGKKLGIPSVDDALVRTRETRPMRGLSPEERRENVRGVFRLDEGLADEIRGKRVLLLDDFFTTGATAVECAKALRDAPIKNVILYAFAAR